MALFETEITLPAPPADLFAFLIQPENLKQIAPADMGLKFLDAPEKYQLGDIFQFMVQAMGQVQTITHKITVFEEPHLFVEELVEGPMPLWIHTHTFTIIDDNQTLVQDKVEFEPPGGLMGFLLTESRILDHLDDGFYHRYQKLHKLFA